MAEKFPSLEEYTKQLISRCQRYNNIPYLKVKNIDNATHWIALEDKDTQAGITVGNAYRLYHDAYDDETIIIDDNKAHSLIYLCHEGQFITMKGSDRWNRVVKQWWDKEYRQTDEYREMIRQSMEAVRESWERD